ncbi:MAG: PAS domain-containing protein [Clostridia bacterium]|nr:PAS domain-containing protein [Clostridia bacterium]
MSQYLKLRQKHCRSCHKCIRHCPLKAIRFSGGHARIVADDCIWCGLCYNACPQTTKEIFSERYAVEGMLKSGVPVVASLAPSFAAQFGGATIRDVETALKRLGFACAEETAVGATKVCEAYNELLDEGRDIVISSSCPSVNLMIQKYYPEALPYLAPVLSPMQTHALDIKERIPDAKVVFIGPCIAKKDEAERYEGYADAVLTFDQLGRWLEELDIEITPTGKGGQHSSAAIFPVTRGIIRAMGEKKPGYTYIAVDGVKECMAALTEIQKGTMHKCFIEMSACESGCIGGPGRTKTTLMDVSLVEQNVDKNFTFPVTYSGSMKKEFTPLPRKREYPSEEMITEILARMGKTTKEDELNCGGCGYSTCRDKVVAIYRGKADISMCLPYLKEKAETFSDTIINNTPNGIIVLNHQLEIQQINRSAMNMLGVEHRIDVMGEPVSQLMNPEIFSVPLEKKQRISTHHLHLEEQNAYFEITNILDAAYSIIIAVIRNITEETIERQKKEAITTQTVDIADKVVDKQMRIVQEIASLLGETAAETKIALSKLKESITHE